MNPHEEEPDDDKPVGRVLSRREVLGLLGGASAALISAPALARLGFLQQLTPTPTPAVTACVVRPELTEGPYFVDNMLSRSDIRINSADERISEGKRLRLVFKVTALNPTNCIPIEGAQVDVWHCDASGVYSGVEDPGFNTQTSDFLRGYQLTDDTGTAEFITIVPGWYPGRAVHIHFKIRTDPQGDTGYEFTSQFFFDPDVIETVYREAPYAAKGQADTPNHRDRIYDEVGEQLVLTLEPEEAYENEYEREEVPGYVAVFDIALDLSNTSSTTRPAGPGSRS
jgi:protocatechuate 3,4-dioxygenase beta subunit